MKANAAHRIKQWAVRPKPLAFSILRGLFAPIVFYFIYVNKLGLAAGAFGFAVMCAYMDYAASKRSVPDELHSIFDSLADKALIFSVCTSLWITGKLGTIFMLIFVGREIVTIIGGATLIFRHRYLVFHPNPLTNVVFFFEMLAFSLFFFQHPDKILLQIAAFLSIASLGYTMISEEFRIIQKPAYASNRIRSFLSLPDYVTLGNAVFGLAAIWLSSIEQHSLAALALLLAVVADVLDGKIARMIRREGDFGKQLDSLADTISFGVAPAAFGFTMIKSPLAIIGYCIFLFAGILRLARFNVTDMKGEYEGLPITVNGILIPLIYFTRVPLQYYPYIFIISAALMVSTLRVKKLKV